MSYYVRKESVIAGEVANLGSFPTMYEARMALANEVEKVCEADSTLARRDIQQEVDEAVRTGHKEISDAVGNVVYAFSIEQE